MSIRARIIDAIIFIVGTLFFKKAFPKLTENAVSGWLDDKIGELLGWSFARCVYGIKLGLARRRRRSNSMGISCTL